MKLIIHDIAKQQKAEIEVQSRTDNLVQGIILSHSFDTELLSIINEFEDLVNNFVVGEVLDDITEKLDAYNWNVEHKDWIIYDFQIFDLKHISFKIKDTSVFSTTDFIAKLMFFHPDEGGRKSAVTSGYRPHIKFNEYPDYITTGQQIYLNQDTVQPGEKEVMTKISIVNKEVFKGKLCKNVCFEFCEGKHRIGFGRIIEVLNESLKVNWDTIKNNHTIIYPEKDIAMYTLSNPEVSKLCWTDISYAFYKFRSFCKYHFVIQSEEVDLRTIRFNDVEAYFKEKLREICVAHIVIIKKADKGFETKYKGFKTDIYVDNLEKATEQLHHLQNDTSRIFDFEYTVSEDDNWTDLGILLY